MAYMKMKMASVYGEDHKRPKGMEENEIYEEGYCGDSMSRKYEMVGQSDDPRAKASRKQIEDGETVLLDPYARA